MGDLCNDMRNINLELNKFPVNRLQRGKCTKHDVATMTSVRHLDPSVIREIQSSLVITSLQACLQELVYNALDANATSIDVAVNINKYLVRVTDNGVGIPSQDLDQLATRYVTSKCHTIADLQSTHSFGFRGEALASIAEASILQITSRHAPEKDAYMALWKGGALMQKTKGTLDSRYRSGTIVTVQDLFYKYPVRRKRNLDLSNAQVTMDSIRRSMVQIVLPYPEINFSLTDLSRNTKLLVVKKCGSSADVFRQVFGDSLSRTLQLITLSDHAIKIHAYFGVHGVPTKIHQYIYINRQWISTAELYKAITSIWNYSSSNTSQLPDNDESDSRKKRGRFMAQHPMFLIFIDHPSMTTCDISFYQKLTTEHKIHATLKRLLERITASFLHRFELLDKSSYRALVKTIDAQYKQVERYPSSTDDHEGTKKFTTTTPSSIKETLRSGRGDVKHRTSVLEEAPQSGSMETMDERDERYEIFQGIQLPIKLSREDLLKADVLGQVDGKFILLKGQENLVIVDQHAADERIKLEKMLARMDPIETVHIDPGIKIQLTSHEYELLVRFTPYLHTWGIHFSCHFRKSTSRTSLAQSRHFITSEASPHFSVNDSRKDTIYIEQLPQLVADRCIINEDMLADLIKEYLYWLEGHDFPDMAMQMCPHGMMEILKSKACRGAIMFNDLLTLSDCQHIITALAACQFPFQCAHGRPSITPLASLNQMRHLETPSRPIHWQRFVT
ncbi:uncharacterized protein BYT42DRAFT_574154 [Radiomyces spectabilis]|uniref:uncharacterized protein n=1 Tax=Radiomyces spectabilis TaxID=64574 RepID=UPI002220639F|nr:uncharacterized protein BYT42DRAFT_574154 [Radiomyces spectabilis]KAI8376310.1 hypothetical protein BYT42DRAFT_574154 [Radiomyces spectabilis]